ncbi:MAG: hypothetical protein SGJ20_15285 [Planctomycetota bacterium]|nr:hypothetical protein [Planctomycetota bacterium]
MIYEKLAIILITIGGMFSLLNWLAAVLSIKHRKKYSFVPIFGAVQLAIGMLMLPESRPYAWAALFIDIGTLDMLTKLTGEWVYARRTNRRNLVAEYIGTANRQMFHLHLYRSYIFELVLERRYTTPQHPFRDWTNGTWRLDGDQLILHDEGKTAILEHSHTAGGDKLRLVTGFATWEKEPDLSLANFELALETGNSPWSSQK